MIEMQHIGFKIYFFLVTWCSIYWLVVYSKCIAFCLEALFYYLKAYC